MNRSHLPLARRGEELILPLRESRKDLTHPERTLALMFDRYMKRFGVKETRLFPVFPEFADIFVGILPLPQFSTRAPHLRYALEPSGVQRLVLCRSTCTGGDCGGCWRHRFSSCPLCRKKLYVSRAFPSFRFLNHRSIGHCDLGTPKSSRRPSFLISRRSVQSWYRNIEQA